MLSVLRNSTKSAQKAHAQGDVTLAIQFWLVEEKQVLEISYIFSILPRLIHSTFLLFLLN